MTPGDVYEFVFPGVGGLEQHGRRPAVVIQDDGYAGWLRTTVVVPLSTQVGAANFPGVVSVPRSSENGLRFDSVALVFQIRVVDRRKQSFARWGRVDDVTLSAIHDALDRLLGRTRPPAGSVP